MDQVVRSSLANPWLIGATIDKYKDVENYVWTKKGDWPKILHSGNDQASKVHPVSVYLAYRDLFWRWSSGRTNHLVPRTSD